MKRTVYVLALQFKTRVDSLVSVGIAVITLELSFSVKKYLSFCHLHEVWVAQTAIAGLVAQAARLSSYISYQLCFSSFSELPGLAW